MLFSASNKHCAALPLLEGYDEWSHFATVQRVALRGEPLVSRFSQIPRDVTASLVFFFNDTATTEIYTLSLHDALPISSPWRPAPSMSSIGAISILRGSTGSRSRRHSSSRARKKTSYSNVATLIPWTRAQECAPTRRSC